MMTHKSRTSSTTAEEVAANLLSILVTSEQIRSVKLTLAVFKIAGIGGFLMA